MKKVNPYYILFSTILFSGNVILPMHSRVTPLKTPHFESKSHQAQDTESTPIQKKIDINQEKKKCTITYFYPTKIVKKVYDFESLLAQLNSDQLAQLSQGNIRPLFDIIPDFSSNTPETAQRDLNALHRKETLDHLNQRAHESMDYLENLYQEQITGIILDQNFKIKYEDQIQQLAVIFEEFLDIPSMEKLFCLDEFKLNIDHPNELVQEFINNQNAQLQDIINYIYSQMVHINCRYEIEKIGANSQNIKEVIISKISSFFATACPWKFTEIIKNLAQKNPHFRSYIEDNTKGWNFRPINFCYSLVSRCFGYSREQIKKFQHYQKLLKIHLLFKAQKFDEARRYASHNQIEQQLIWECNKKYRLPECQTNKIEIALSNQARQLFAYFEVRPETCLFDMLQRNPASEERDLISEKLLLTFNQIADTIYTTDNVHTRILYIGLMDSLIQTSQFYQINHPEELAKVFDAQHQINSEAAQARIQRIYNVFNAVCRQLKYNALHPIEFIMNSIKGTVFVSLWLIDAVIINNFRTAEQQFAWMDRNATMFKQFSDQFSQLSSDEVDNLTGSVIADCLTSHLITVGLPKTLQLFKIPKQFPPSKIFQIANTLKLFAEQRIPRVVNKLGQWATTTKNVSSYYWNKLAKFWKSEPVVVTPEGVPVRENVFKEMFFKMQHDVENLGGHAAAVLSGYLKTLEAEIPFLEQAFSCTRKGFADFQNKYIKVDYKHILGLDFKPTRKGMKLTGFHHDWHGFVQKNGILPFKDIVIHKSGIYKAKVWYNGIMREVHFFPQTWSREQVISKIFEAYDNFIAEGAKKFKLLPDGKFEVLGLTNEKIQIKMNITANGVIKTAYPQFKVD